MNYSEYNIYNLSDDLGPGKKNLRFLTYIIYNKQKFYKPPFNIDKKSGGTRTICAPDDELKKIQRNILDKILDGKLVHPNCHGFCNNRSILTNAAEHKDKKIVLKLDISDFFPSIKSKRVRGLFESFSLKENVVFFFNRINNIQWRTSSRSTNKSVYFKSGMQENGLQIE